MIVHKVQANKVTYTQPLSTTHPHAQPTNVRCSFMYGMGLKFSVNSTACNWPFDFGWLVMMPSHVDWVKCACEHKAYTLKVGSHCVPPIRRRQFSGFRFIYSLIFSHLSFMNWFWPQNTSYERSVLVEFGMRHIIMVEYRITRRPAMTRGTTDTYKTGRLN